MTEPVLLYEVEDGVATLTLNRPDKRNALDSSLVAALKEALDRADADESVRVVTVTGAGKDFCSGADLTELERIATMSADENLEDARSLGALFIRMREHRCPVVALVRGRALAGGCGLATACDVVVAEEGAEFGYPEVHLGFVPAMVMAMLRRKVSEGSAFDMVVNGARVSASTAADLGLVQHVFDPAAFEAATRDYVAGLAKRPPGAVALTKRLLYDLDGLDLADGIELGARVNVEARMSEECRAGVRRFLERSPR
ncbi:MAG: enoyl-CoA hydratase/isomerase family protein [Gemmatimonadota bacterium]|nr:enoyl-CoA hydratase/isomerase family protein [Gemmatimonadota bacterium]